MSNENLQDPPSDDDDEWKMFKDVGMRKLTPPEIEKIYHFSGIISQNRNASVRLCIHHITGDKVAIKILNKSTLKEQKKKVMLLREISTMRLLGDYKNVTEIYDLIDTGDRIWVVMEYCGGGELFNFVKAKAPLSDSTAREVFRPIVKTVAYMHSLHIVHRDLKLENVFLDDRGRLRLGDFGFSRYYDPKDGLIDTVCGTPQYSPPEIIKSIPHNPIYVDSWSLGVILYVQLCGDFPFKGLSIPELLQSIVKAELHIPDLPTDLAKDLLQRLLNPDPNERLAPSEIMKHPWINKNRLPKPPKKDHTVRLNRAAMQVIKDLGVIKDGEEEHMDVDQTICYRLIRRKYQLGYVPLPNVGNTTRPSDLPPALSSMKHLPSILPPVKKPMPMGMSSPMVRERLPPTNTFLKISQLRCRTPSRMQRQAAQKTQGKLRDIRKGMTMRFWTIFKDETELPILNCTHTTLDEPHVLWSKLFQFMSKDDELDIISEYDFSLYCKLNGPREVYFALTIGCVHRGFGMIGFSIQKLRGDQGHLDDWEAKLSEFLGF